MSRTENHIRVMHETAYAEYGSALEMLSACKLSKKETFCFGYFHHAKDEYQHTQSFLSLLARFGKNIPAEIAKQFRFTSQEVINKGYVSANSNTNHTRVSHSVLLREQLNLGCQAMAWARAWALAP